MLESRLKESGYLAGDKFTIADIASFPWILNGPEALGLDLGEWPHLKKWVEKIIARPGAAKGMQVPPPPFTPEQFVEFCKAKRAEVMAMENSDKH